MKDATGELSMIAVAVVAIAAIALLFTRVIWPQLEKNIMRNSYCTAAFNCQCDDSADMCQCSYCATQEGDDFSATCDDPQPIDCPRK